MLRIHDTSSLREAVAAARGHGQSIGLVPTMGNLHDGHLSLLQQAKSRCEFVITSIFVNPMQFGANEDLAAYPRTPEQDVDLLTRHGCDCLFMPTVDEMYPAGTHRHTVVSVPELGSNHCGKSRPGHFEGVATVVSKLFNMAQPDAAFFGLKDYQQFLVISRMARDLCFPVSVIGIETRREPSGLAMSSRNNYLTREQAAALYRCLKTTAQSIGQGVRDYDQLEHRAEETLRAEGMRPDYFSVCNAATLAAAGPEDSDLVILAAAYIGSTRLIDNIRLQAG